MQTQAGAKILLACRSIRQCGEYAELDRAKQRLGPPKTEPQLHDLIGCDGRLGATIADKSRLDRSTRHERCPFQSEPATTISRCGYGKLVTIAPRPVRGFGQTTPSPSLRGLSR